MISYSLFLGARQTSSGRFRPKDERRLQTITRDHFPDGFSILRARGGWLDPEKGRFIHEESRQILVTAKTRTVLKAWCAALAEAFSQDELIVVELGRSITFRFGKSQRQSREPRT